MTPRTAWLPSIKSRIGKLMLHGTHPAEARESSALLQTLAHNWRRYVAMREGYLVTPQHRGLYRHAVVWGEMDSIGHVNNVAYSRWAESARINWTRCVAIHVDPDNRTQWETLWTSCGLGLILRGLNMEYKFPMRFPDKVSVYHRLISTGDDSFKLGAIILSEKHQRVSAKCTEDIVVYNYQPSNPLQNPGKVAIPPFMEKVFKEIFHAQEKAARDAEEEMADIEERLNVLERHVMSRDEMN